MSEKIRNVGPKSAAWLKQVGIHSFEELKTLGSVNAFMKVKRAGFKASLNFLYALEGAIRDCHWNDISADDKGALVLEVNEREDSSKRGPLIPGAVSEMSGEEYQAETPELTLFNSLEPTDRGSDTEN